MDKLKLRCKEAYKRLFDVYKVKDWHIIFLELGIFLLTLIITLWLVIPVITAYTVIMFVVGISLVMVSVIYIGRLNKNG